MKTIYYYKYILILALLFTGTLNAQVSETKTIRKSFAINPDGDLIIDSKYGFIQCINWEKDSIAVVVEVQVSSKDQLNTRALLNSIRCDFQSAPVMLSIKTHFDDNGRGVVKKYIQATELFDNNDIDVNYTIYVPKTVNLDIENKFGDVNLEDHFGRNEISLQYGDLRFDNFGNTCNLELRYGRLIGREIANGKLNLKNYNLRIKSANELDVTSSGSEINIAKINFLNIRSSKDQLEFKDIGKIVGTLRFSSIEIDVFTGVADFTLTNSDFIIEELGKFETIILNSEASNIEFGVVNSSFKVNADLYKGRLRVPSSSQNISKIWIDESEDHRKVTLAYGEASSRTIIIRAKKGNVTLWD